MGKSLVMSRWVFWAFSIIGLGFGFCRSAEAGELVLVLSSDEPEYLQAAAGFKSGFSGQFREINLAGSDAKQRSVGEELKASPPAGAVVVGDLAGQMAKWYLAGVPLVYCDVPRAAALAFPSGKYIGIYHEPDPLEQLKSLPELFAGKTRVGLLYGAGSAQFNPQELERKAQALGLTLEPVALGSIQEVPGKLRELLPRINLLWVLTDPVILSERSIQYLVLQSVSAGVPIFCGDLSLARHGATAALVPDWQDAGRQAAQAAEELLRGSGRPRSALFYPKGKLILNQKIAGMLKVAFPASSVSLAQERIQ